MKLRAVLLLAGALSVTLAVADTSMTAAPQSPTTLLVTVSSGKDLHHQPPPFPALPGAGSSLPGHAGDGPRRYQSAPRHHTQQLRVADGHSAHIAYRQSLPYPTIVAAPGVHGGWPVAGLEYRELEQGYTVRPQVSGERLLLNITLVKERPAAAGGGRLEADRLETTISGSLGQWIRLDGGNESPAANSSTRVYSSAPRATRKRPAVWVRVDRLDAE